MYTDEEMSEEAVRSKVEAEVESLSDKEIKDKLPSYRQTETLATLHMNNQPVRPLVMAAFSDLAKALDMASKTEVQMVISGYSPVIIKTLTRKELIDALVQEEQGKMSTANYHEKQAAKELAEKQAQEKELNRLQEELRAEISGTARWSKDATDPE
jgi:hypothetical protein